ncbi:MAG: glycosyl hydrolase [Pyrinomonadaceae bacterium]|nr:glycosyl hydrolase [Pyrinomonadaceae bacterium]
MKLLIIFLAFFVFVPTVSAKWQKYDVKTDAGFRGLDVVSEKIIWASGTGGTVIRTIDGGRSWDVITVPGAEKLDFRDIEAFDEDTAYILSIGNGENSRIYKTTDGGESWNLQFKNTIEKAFFDSIAFWDEKNGMAQSDPVDGIYVFYRTTDGEKWTRVSSKKMPRAKKGEAAFAASGTCIVTKGTDSIWLITGGMDARVFYSKNRGKSWNAYTTPMIRGTQGSGIFSIAMFDQMRGAIVGGNYEKPNETKNNLAFTTDGGKTWQAGTGLSGYRSGVTYIDQNVLLAVGSNGSNFSDNGGRTWQKLDEENYNAVDSVGNINNWRKTAWAVGPKGMVSRFERKIIRLDFDF